jgi:hypothetical protein
MASASTCPANPAAAAEPAEACRTRVTKRLAPARPYDLAIMDEHGTASVSALRLRLGVFLVVLWWLPFWALSPYIADSMSSLSNPPSVAAVTTVIVVVQTILGIIGFLIAGAQVKQILKGSPKKQAFGTMSYILIHGKVRDGQSTGAESRRPMASLDPETTNPVTVAAEEAPEPESTGPITMS